MLYNALAFLNPRLLMVPLVACAGWDAGALQSPSFNAAMLMPCSTIPAQQQSLALGMRLLCCVGQL